MGDKAGTASDRAVYAIAQLVRDGIVAGLVAAAIIYLSDNGYIGASAGLTALGIWRVIRPQVLSALDGFLRTSMGAKYTNGG